MIIGPKLLKTKITVKQALKPFVPPKRHQLIGREDEIRLLNKISKESTPAIITIHGRRRVGKTALIEETFRKRRILKFEGQEAFDESHQIKNCLEQLSRYLSDPKIMNLSYTTWREFFLLLWEYIKKGGWTVYFEELQWLANYKTHFISELKYIWDNYYQGNQELLIILCGSSPSFMINHVIHSKALYNRSQYELALKPLKIKDLPKLVKFRTTKQIFDAYLMIGGIPEYLKYMKGEPTAIRCISQHSFTDSGFFVNEYDKIFISSLAKNKNYRRILECIATNYSLSSEEIAKKLKLKRNGSFKRVMQDLELCGFIARVRPFDVGSNSTLIRYEIADNYLHYYYDFIKPIESKIKRGDFNKSCFEVIKPTRLSQWLGYAFERFLRQNPAIIAKMLGFGGIEYESGAYFNRTLKDQKFQIDLAYLRRDRVLTICEIKYTDSPVTTSIIKELDAKISRIHPNLLKRYELQRVLISKEGASKEVHQQGYFDRVITLEEVGFE